MLSAVIKLQQIYLEEAWALVVLVSYSHGGFVVEHLARTKRRHSSRRRERRDPQVQYVRYRSNAKLLLCSALRAPSRQTEQQNDVAEDVLNGRLWVS